GGRRRTARRAAMGSCTKNPPAESRLSTDWPLTVTSVSGANGVPGRANPLRTTWLPAAKVAPLGGDVKLTVGGRLIQLTDAVSKTVPTLAVIVSRPAWLPV